MAEERLDLSTNKKVINHRIDVFEDELIRIFRHYRLCLLAKGPGRYCITDYDPELDEVDYRELEVELEGYAAQYSREVEEKDWKEAYE